MVVQDASTKQQLQYLLHRGSVGLVVFVVGMCLISYSTVSLVGFPLLCICVFYCQVVIVMRLKGIVCDLFIFTLDQIIVLNTHVPITNYSQNITCQNTKELV